MPTCDSATWSDIDLAGRRVLFARRSGTRVRRPGARRRARSPRPYGIPGVEDHAFGLKTLAPAVRGACPDVLRQFERVTVDPHAAGDRRLTVVIGGRGTDRRGVGGWTGGTVRARSCRRTSRPWTSAGPGWCSSNPPDRLLARSPRKPSEKARRDLAPAASRWCSASASQASTRRWWSSPTVAGSRRAPSCGPRGSGRPTRRHARRAAPRSRCASPRARPGWSRPRGPDLSLPEHPEVFVIGDLAAATARGRALPPGRSGRDAGWATTSPARSAAARGRPRPVPLPRKGSMATIGRHAAVAAAARRNPFVRYARLARVARPAPAHAGRLPQPGERAGQLGVELRHLRPRSRLIVGEERRARDWVGLSSRAVGVPRAG